MTEPDVHLAVRGAARAFEEALPPNQRKRLGQFFSGLQLGRLLAHLAISDDTRSAIDPMAGNGDLLDCIWQAASERGVSLTRLDGIEIDPDTALHCQQRLDTIIGTTGPKHTILTGSAFDSHHLNQLSTEAYDLVITNPPYVRYQSRTGKGARTPEVRSALLEGIEGRTSEAAAPVWKTLAKGYSGFSDLSIPSWLLAGLMVRPGGRLALVAPAIWRSRDYADVVRYLLLRCFSIESIVEDTQPGWFSDALVRTHLIVARRVDDDQVSLPLCARQDWPAAKWIRIAPLAANEHSLTGLAFPGNRSEARFASWVNAPDSEPIESIEWTSFDVAGEWSALHARACRRRWYKALETIDSEVLPLLSLKRATAAAYIPQPLLTIMPQSIQPDSLLTLEQAGIHVGQGLRTGCNAFFYVDACGSEKCGMVSVRGASALGSPEFHVPAGVLRPVVRGQADAQYLEQKKTLTGRILDLRQWILPEDLDAVLKAQALYKVCGKAMPQVMPDELAAFVRNAATQIVTGSGKRIPELTAVRTNVRNAGCRGQPPRFWYMLPDFSARHLPAAFMPRIIHRTPWAKPNGDPPIIIDANFSTFLLQDGADWTPHSLTALLNSVWCRTFVELLGTTLGGGALKLEATHLRQMLVPQLGRDEKRALAVEGKKLAHEKPDLQTKIDQIVLCAVIGNPDKALPKIANDMAAHAIALCNSRQKATP